MKKSKSCLRYSEDNWPKAETIGGEPWPAPDTTLPHTGGGSCKCKTCVPRLKIGSIPAGGVIPHTGEPDCDCRACIPRSPKRPESIQLAPGIPMPDQRSATWPTVFAFACAMEHKLSLNRRKGDVAGWRKYGSTALQERLDDEVEELNTALSDYYNSKTGRSNQAAHKTEVLLEAADVANFSLMIADCVQNEK